LEERHRDEQLDDERIHEVDEKGAHQMMFGLLFGTMLTVILVPTLYATFYRIASPK
jgi:multidrug efflux pump subunit AcrB